MASTSASSSIEFKQLVEKYTTLSDELAASGKVMRELRKKSKELGESILEFMRKNDIEEVEVSGNGRLKRRVSKRTAPLSKDVIADELRAHVSPDEVPAIVEKILLRRETTETTALKRLKN
jgi:hypothetical protein